MEKNSTSLNERFHRWMLGHVGLDAAACDRVLAKVASESHRIARMRSMCGNTLQVLERSGVLKDEGLRARFIEAGLLERDRAY